MKLNALLLAGFAALTASASTLLPRDGETIAFLGDSITQQGNGPVGYVNLVMKGLEVAGLRDLKKIPAGIGGHKSPQMRDRLQRDVLDRHPEWMTLSCGVNDVMHGANGVELEPYKANISNILDRCAEAGVKVVVLTATMIREDPANDANRKLAAYNDFLRAEAAARGLPLADLNADMQAIVASHGGEKNPDGPGGNWLTRDGVHMVWDGNRMMARGVLRAFGVDESLMPEIEAAWRTMPGYRDYAVQVSADEADAIEARAKASGKNPVAAAREFLLRGEW